MAANGMKVIALEEGWKQLKNEAINKLLEQLDAAASGRNMEKPFDHKARSAPPTTAGCHLIRVPGILGAAELHAHGCLQLLCARA